MVRRTPASCREVLVLTEVECAQTKFLNAFGRRRPDERKHCSRILLPDGEIFRRDCEPSERERVSARFGYLADLGPRDFVDGQFSSLPCECANIAHAIGSAVWGRRRPSICERHTLPI